MPTRDPRSPARDGVAYLCGVEGEHELCDRWLDGETVEGFRGLGHPPPIARRCTCGCHRKPWPFPHDG